MHVPITRASGAFVALARASVYVAACGSPPTAIEGWGFRYTSFDLGGGGGRN